MGVAVEEHVLSWLTHIRVLSKDIGPRGSATLGERRGSEYCEQVFSGLGLDPVVEEFRSARSIYYPHLLAASLMLMSFAVYPLSGRASALAAAAIAVLALASDLLELSFLDNPLRRLTPKGPSQNVVATISPAGEHRRDILLIGHVDSQQARSGTNRPIRTTRSTRASSPEPMHSPGNLSNTSIRMILRGNAAGTSLRSNGKRAADRRLVRAPCRDPEGNGSQLSGRTPWERRTDR